MRPERDNHARTVELHSATERGWWLRTRRPDAAVNVLFVVESATPADAMAVSSRGPFQGLAAVQEGRMVTVQVFLDGVVGGFIIDLDTADGESRVIHPTRHGLEGALGTASAGYFLIAPIQLADDESDT